MMIKDRFSRIVLLALGRVQPIIALGGAGDFILGTLFTVSYFRLKLAQAQ